MNSVLEPSELLNQYLESVEEVKEVYKTDILTSMNQEAR
jgi:hypothetical protein